MSNKNIIIVHGIHTHGGRIDRFGDRLWEAGYNVREFEFPKRWALTLYLPWIKKKDGAALASFMQDGDHVVAHSYGCLVWQWSIKAGAKWGKCFLFGGACTSDKLFYPDDCLKEAHVIYNPEDKALWLGSLLPWHPFGKLGYRGYVGQPSRKKIDRRFINIRGFKDGPGANHSHYFGTAWPKWLKFIKDRLA